jgi:hypothetical protein
MKHRKRPNRATLFASQPSAQAKIKIAGRFDSAKAGNYPLQLSLFSGKRFTSHAVRQMVVHRRTEQVAWGCFLDFAPHVSAVHFSHSIPQR